MDRTAASGGVIATPSRERQAGLTDLERLYAEALGDLERDLKDYEPYDWIPPMPQVAPPVEEDDSDPLAPMRGVCVGVALSVFVWGLLLFVTWWLS